VDIIVFINEASETSIPLEVAEKAQCREDIHVTVYSFFEPSLTDTSCDLISLDARSQTDFRAYRRLYRRLKRHQTDVFHVHPNTTGSIARIVAKAAGVPTLFTTEHSDHERFGTLKNMINGGTNWLNDAVISNSYSTANSFAVWENTLLDLADTRKEVIYNGVDLERIDAAVEERDPPELPSTFIFGTASRLVHAKNIEVIIESASRLNEEIDFHVAIAGKGPKEDDLRNLVQTRSVEDTVTFLGYLSREDVYAFFDEIDVFLFPSRYEGFGVAATEAMAVDTPIIANDIDVLREVIDDAGYFVDARDAEKVAKAMKDIYMNPKIQAELANEARERTRSNFTMQETVQKYVSLYQESVSKYD